MKKILFIYSPFILLFSILFFSCQTEIHFADQPSAGSLKKDASGNCLPIVVAGSFINGKDLTNINYIEVEVNVTTKGNYAITTDIVNGYSFKATGNFSNAGSYRVKLIGSGRPVATGSNDFIVRYDSSICHATVNVTDDLTTPAIFTFPGSPASCMNDTVTGTYIKNVSLDTTAKVKVVVLVTKAGTYTVTTNTVNGYSFSASGTIPATGQQTIILKGTGKPINAGIDVFTVSANGIPGCTFPVTVLTPVSITNNDYFPLTTNSHWTYDDFFLTGDSLQRRITDSTIINTDLYKIMQEQSLFANPLPSTHNFSKVGPNYYEYCSVDRYTNSMQYASPLYGLIPFLKENLNTNDSWQSAEFSALASFGQEIRIRYLFSCTEANANVTVNGYAFANVYKVVMQPQIASVGNAWGSTSEVYTYYYAKGIGMVYAKKIRNGSTFSELQIRNWVVY